MDIPTYVQIDGRMGPLRRICRPLLKSLIKRLEDDLYVQLLSEYPQWFVTDFHKQTAFPNKNPDRVSEEEVADSYRSAIEEIYIYCMLYIVAVGLFTITWYGLTLFLIDYFILDLSWSLVGTSYNFLGAIMVARLKVGPSHFTVQVLTDAHKDPLQLILGEQIMDRLKEHLGFLVIAGGFLITFISESGFLRLVF